jgi:cellulose 1,4-beta-cellobiosidase
VKFRRCSREEHTNRGSAIVTSLKKYPMTAIALIIEPDSLPNLVTNANLQTCKDSAAGYREGVAYALKQLNLPNVAMYIDAGHGGWLGWNDNLSRSPQPFQIPHAY